MGGKTGSCRSRAMSRSSKEYDSKAFLTESRVHSERLGHRTYLQRGDDRVTLPASSGQTPIQETRAKKFAPGDVERAWSRRDRGRLRPSREAWSSVARSSRPKLRALLSLTHERSLTQGEPRMEKSGLLSAVPCPHAAGGRAPARALPLMARATRRSFRRSSSVGLLLQRMIDRHQSRETFRWRSITDSLSPGCACLHRRIMRRLKRF